MFREYKQGQKSIYLHLVRAFRWELLAREREREGEREGGRKIEKMMNSVLRLPKHYKSKRQYTGQSLQ